MSNDRQPIWIGLRKLAGPPKHKQAAGTGFNSWLAIKITSKVGTHVVRLRLRSDRPGEPACTRSMAAGQRSSPGSPRRSSSWCC